MGSEETMRTRMIPRKVIERLSRYRSFLVFAASKEVERSFSREIAEACGASAAQVRRDLMVVGCAGGSNQGYSVDETLEGIEKLFMRRGPMNAGIVGVGRLGGAIVDYLNHRRSWVRLVAAFEIDPPTGDHLIGGIRRYPMSSLEKVVGAKSVALGIIAVPSEIGQSVADRLVSAGIKGIINYTPTTLRVPKNVCVENIDMTAALERVGYFARAQRDEERS